MSAECDNRNQDGHHVISFTLGNDRHLLYLKMIVPAAWEICFARHGQRFDPCMLIFMSFEGKENPFCMSNPLTKKVKYFFTTALAMNYHYNVLTKKTISFDNPMYFIVINCQNG